jgi:hypothetical protein
MLGIGTFFAGVHVDIRCQSLRAIIRIHHRIYLSKRALEKRTPSRVNVFQCLGTFDLVFYGIFIGRLILLTKKKPRAIATGSKVRDYILGGLVSNAICYRFWVFDRL